MFSLLLIKFVTTTGIVLGLSIIAEHISPRAAGILSGLPLGAAIVIYFVGFEQGTQFAGDTALAMVLGLTASLAFLYAYWIASYRLFPGNNIFKIAKTSLFAISTFLTMAYLLSLLPQKPELMITSTLVACVCAMILFRKIPNLVVQSKVKLSLKVLSIRAVIAVLIVLLITGFAASLGPQWSGLFASFPITLFPLLIIIHNTYSEGHAWSIIKNFPVGMGSLIIYGICASIYYPLYGINLGTIISMLIAVLYLAIIGKIIIQFSKFNPSTD